MRWYLECLKKYATFSGRARRKEYWMFALVNFLVLVVLFALTVVEAVARGDVAENGVSAMGVLSILYSLALVVPSWAAAVRRMHDTNHRGWWLFVPIVPLVFAFMDGNRGDNRFGPDPKATGSSADAARYAA